MCEYENINTEVKNKYILIIARKNSLNDNMEVEVFEANINNENDKNNKLPAK